MSKAGDPKNLQKAFYFHQAGQPGKAAAIYRQILTRQPANADALHYLGIIEAANGNLARAKSLLARSLKAQPANIPFIENYATVLLQAGEFESALEVCSQGLQLNQTNVSLLYVSAVALLRLNRSQESIAHFDKVLLLQPNHLAAINERGSALVQMKSYDEALVSFAKAQALEPRYAEAHFNEALCRLLTGDFVHGWEKHEWRWQIGEAQTQRRNFAQPQWYGQGNITGTTILLIAEQGLGDTLQFCRYVPLLAARGARVILEVQKPLQRLMQTLRGTPQIISKGDPLPAFGLHCPLLSLPLAFGTRIETIPSSTPYLSASPTVATDRSIGRPRIGLVWSGSPTNKNDHNRSIRLSALAPLLNLDASFVSLQKDIRAGDAPALHALGERIESGHELKDFTETAALVSDLDLIITVDTSVAHLAGALGKPVWILLPFVPDWRWLVDRDDSPWYPTARLFRQDDSRSWDTVIARVCVALRDYIGSR